MKGRENDLSISRKIGVRYVRWGIVLSVWHLHGAEYIQKEPPFHLENINIVTMHRDFPHDAPSLPEPRLSLAKMTEALA